jgi:uncharacterized protein YqjF (DUF2071 family)
VAGREPEEHVAVPLVTQRWRQVTFLHWPYEPAVVAHLLPRGLTVDEWEGRAWVGLVLFSVDGMSAGPVPFLGRRGRFPETNVRTYVKGPDGRDGLLFLSLDVDSVTTVIGGRLGPQVPYHWADMSVTGGDGSPVRYRSRRRPPEPVRAGHDVEILPGAPMAGNSFDDWLTGRWRAWTRIAGNLTTVPVQHQPWALAHATAVRVEQDLLSAAGLPRPSGEPLVHWSTGVDARLGGPRGGNSGARARVVPLLDSFPFPRRAKD